MDDWEALMARMEQAPGDWDLLRVASDYCEEQGWQEKALALRWLADNRQRVSENDNTKFPGTFAWSCNDGFGRHLHRVGCHQYLRGRMHRILTMWSFYDTFREAMEDYFRAFARQLEEER